MLAVGPKCDNARRGDQILRIGGKLLMIRKVDGR